MNLPIQAHIPEIKKALDRSRCVVIQAPPGAGKTTRVPLALVDQPWLGGKKIILLEPRRLAARSCAGHMAALINEHIGQTIGYQVRLDRKIGPTTRIEVVTEGIFTRKIQNDPLLEDVGLVIFDEFHERSIHSDLGLALTLDTFEALRPDLRLVVMSATMDVKAISSLLGHAPVVVSQGKSFRVDTRYIDRPRQSGTPVPIEKTCARVIEQALSETLGDLLVFLPGVGEIKRLARLLEKNSDPSIHVISLYGHLSQKEQARAFTPSLQGERKIVLATSIAETSITIEGIRVVMDSGLMRVPRFSPGTGMTRLETIPVSRSSADQRRGRAGRTASGRCYRLWSEYEHGLLRPFTRPEILSADLSTLVLELAAWGVSDPARLKWLDMPGTAAVDQAKGLLNTLGALDEQGMITAHGKKMAAKGLHPRLSHMVIRGNEQGHGLTACLLAALLGERDFIRFDQGPNDPDIRLRLEVIDAGIHGQNIEQNRFRINRGILQRVIKIARNMARDMKIKASRVTIEKAGCLLALAYPDRIARKRDSNLTSFLTASGKGAYFAEANTVSINEYIVAAALDGNLQSSKIFLAAPYSRAELDREFSHQFKTVRTTFWDKRAGAVTEGETLVFGNLVLEHHTISDIDPDRGCDLLMDEIQRSELALLPWTRALSSLRERAGFLYSTGRFQSLPDLSDRALKTHIKVWLRPFLTGIFSLKQLAQMDLGSAFLSLLSWEQRQIIEKEAPTHIRVPSGSKKPLRYSSEQGLLDSPVLEVRLQEMFGLTRTPKIAGQTIPVTLHLLSPAGRPVQITQDLESFWNTTYAEVKKDLMGRYPKHFWPDDPLGATPTNRAKPRPRPHT